jgi:hypothetical protein
MLLGLVDFVTAAGYASSAVLYNLTDPRFIHKGWTVGSFDVHLRLSLIFYQVDHTITRCQLILAKTDRF